MRWRVAPTLAVALLGVAAVIVGCGGGGQPSCRVYDQQSAAYVVFTGPVPTQKDLQAFCRETGRAFSNIFGHKWKEQRNPGVDYSHDVRRCGQKQPTTVARIDVYDTRSGSAGHRICHVLRHNPFG